MSLYHEAAAVLSQGQSEGGSLKSKIFGNKGLKSPRGQLYALASETCKWSGVLKEVIEASGILEQERKLAPVLSLVLVHDFLLSKGGIALPQSHGLRAAVERHKARLASEFTRSRLRRKLPSVGALRARVDADAATASGPLRPRWVRVNTIKTTVAEQLETTLAGFTAVSSVRDVLDGGGSPPHRVLCVDDNVPDLLALSPGADITRTEAYRSGAIILQDKASCFPACLLDPASLDGDVVDSCAAPGNKTTQLAALLKHPGQRDATRTVFAFEKDKARAETLEKMVTLAGAGPSVRVSKGQDFLRVDPEADAYRNVHALLLDPSCSGSGMVGRDETPDLHLPERRDASGKKPGKDRNSTNTNPRKPTSTVSPISPPPPTPSSNPGKKRKRAAGDTESGSAVVLLDDDGEPISGSTGPTSSSGRDLRARIDALAAFQLSLVLHAFRFPLARRITYSTCSVYARENEEVVLRALGSEVARARGWRILRREEQVRGMREWPVRGSVEACRGFGAGGIGDGGEEKGNNEGEKEGGEGESAEDVVVEGCIRAYADDGHGTMGFFVAAFIREDGDISAEP